MSEIVGKRIEDLYRRTSEFGKEKKNEIEVDLFKKNLKKELEGIRQNLIGLLREIQEKLPPDLTWSKQALLCFSAYDLR